MPLNSTFFAQTADTREKAQSVLVEDYPDAEIEEEQEYAVDIIQTRIGTYDQTHLRIKTLKNIEIYLAASFILDNHSATKDDVDRLYDKGMKLLTDVRDSLTGSVQDASFMSANSTYQTIPAARLDDPNTTTRNYKSTNSFASLDTTDFREIDDPENPLMDSNAPERLIIQGGSKDWQ